MVINNATKLDVHGKIFVKGKEWDDQTCLCVECREVFGYTHFTSIESALRLGFEKHELGVLGNQSQFEGFVSTQHLI